MLVTPKFQCSAWKAANFLADYINACSMEGNHGFS